MRKLMHAILEHQSGALQDDATTVLVEWKASGEERIVPGPGAGLSEASAATAP